MSTDYLIKEDVEEDMVPLKEKERGDKYKNVSLDEAITYMEIVEKHAEKIALGIARCIIACVPLVVAAGMGAPDRIVLSYVSLLLIFVACAVYLFIWAGNINGSYKKLLQEDDYSIKNKMIENGLDNSSVLLYFHSSLSSDQFYHNAIGYDMDSVAGSGSCLCSDK